MSFHIKQGDTFPPLRYTLADASGTPLNLAGASVTFRMGYVPHDPIITGEVDLLDEANGIVEYVWEDGDTDNAGHFRGEFVASLPNGKQLTIPNHKYIPIIIESKLT